MTKRERKYHAYRRGWERKYLKGIASIYSLQQIEYMMAGSPTTIPDVKTVSLSQEMIDLLPKSPPSGTINILGIEIKASSLFPFKMEDGSICHGVVMPELDNFSIDDGEPIFLYQDKRKQKP